MSDLLGVSGANQIYGENWKAADGDVKIEAPISGAKESELKTALTIATEKPIGSRIPFVNEIKEKTEDTVDFYFRGANPKIKTAAEESASK